MVQRGAPVQTIQKGKRSDKKFMKPIQKIKKASKPKESSGNIFSSTTIDQDDNVREIHNLEDEIKELEKKLGVKSDPKKKDKLQKSIESEGLGKGFLSFLDEIESKVKNTKFKKNMKLDEYAQKADAYDFLDSDQEVLLDLGKIDKQKDDDVQSGFSEEIPSQEDEDEEMEEEESMEEEQSEQEPSESSIEDDLNSDGNVTENDDYVVKNFE